MPFYRWQLDLSLGVAKNWKGPLTNLILDPPPPPYNPVKTFFAFENNAGDSGEAKNQQFSEKISLMLRV